MIVYPATDSTTLSSGNYFLAYAGNSTNINGNTYVKHAEIQIKSGGTIKTEVGFVCSSGTSAVNITIRVYVNGTGVGTEHTGANTTNWQQWQDTSISVNAGDLVQLYCKEAAAGSPLTAQYIAVLADASVGAVTGPLYNSTDDDQIIRYLRTQLTT